MILPDFEISVFLAFDCLFVLTKKGNQIIIFHKSAVRKFKSIFFFTEEKNALLSIAEVLSMIHDNITP